MSCVALPSSAMVILCLQARLRQGAQALWGLLPQGRQSRGCPCWTGCSWDSNRVGRVGRSGRWGRRSGRRLLSQTYHCIFCLERGWGCFCQRQKIPDRSWCRLTARFGYNQEQSWRGFFTLANLGHRSVVAEVKYVLHCMIGGLGYR